MKYKILALISAIGLLVSALAIPVKADGGFAIGVIGNMSTFDTTGSETEDADGGTPEVAETSISKDVEFPAIFAEGIVRSDNLGVTLGVEWVPGDASLGTKSRSDTTTDGEETNQDDSTYTANAEVSNHISVYVEPTVYFGNVGLYGKAGVARVTINSLESITSGTDSSVYGNENATGFSRGVGLRAKLGFLLIKAEYLKTNYQKVRFISTTGNKNIIEATPEQESVRIALGFQF